MCKHDDGCNVPEGECSGACMTPQTRSEMLDDAAFIERMRLFGVDHKPSGWPAVQMHLITRLCDLADANISAVKALREDNERLRRIVYTNGDRSMSMEGRYFNAQGSFVGDENFDFDAGLKITGDFVENEAVEYAQMIADVLNSYHTHRQGIAALELETEQLRSQLAELRQGGEAVWFHHVDKDGMDVFMNIPFGLEDETPLFTHPQPAIPPGYTVVPVEPTTQHIDSMCMRHRHDFGLWNEDQKTSLRGSMRQLYEEATGQGFYKITSAPAIQPQAAASVPVAEKDAALIERVTKAILFQDCGSTQDWEINTGLGEAAIKAMLTTLPDPAAGKVKPAYTTGHCEEAKKPGGCQRHNLQCGWPECDRRAAPSVPVAEEKK